MGGQKITSRQKAQAHARHAYYCSCGAVVHGNGACSSHRGKHARAGDGHRYVNREVWKARTPAFTHAGNGTVVGGTDTCTCGYSPEEHGRDPKHPSFTGCVESGCIAYEPDLGEA